TRRAREALGEKPRRSRVLRARARPKNALRRIELLVAHAAVVRFGACGGSSQLVEHLAGRLELKSSWAAEPRSERADDFDVRLHARRRGLHTPPQNHASLEVGHGALFLGPLRSR